MTTERESESRGLKFRNYEDYYLNSQVWLVKADQNMENLCDILNDHFTEINKSHDYALELDLVENYFSNPDLQRNNRKETFNKIGRAHPSHAIAKACGEARG